MKTKLSVFTSVTLISLLLLAGCSGNSAGSGIGKPDESTESAAVDSSEKDTSETAQDKEEKKEGRFKRSGEMPVLLRHRRFEYEHNDAGQLAIDHKYSFFSLDKDYAASHEELAASLDKARDGIETLEKRKRSEESKALKENQQYSYEERWDTYMRRADDSVISILTEYVAVGEFDGQYYTEYTAHNYYTETGEEIKLDEIVTDEDAFFTILAERLKEYLDYANKNIYMVDVELTVDSLKNDIRDYMDSGICVWTLDPQGVSFFLNAYTGLPEGVSATVLFADDKDGNIFDKEFVSDVRDTWITQVPECIGSYLDADDNDKPELVRAHTITEMQEFEGSEEYYISGLRISCDGNDRRFDTVMPGGTSYYDVYLMHKDGKTVALEAHDEYDTAFMTSYKLGDDIEEADSIRGLFEYSEDASEQADTVIPYYVPVDMSRIRVMVEEDNEARDLTPNIMRLDGNGLMELEKGDYEHFKRSEDDGSITVNPGKEQKPFYGVWVGSFKDRQAAVELADKLKEKAFNATYMFSPEWENLNKDVYYCVTAGIASSEEDANELLEDTKKAGYKKAYVKYTGERIAHRVYFCIFDESILDVSEDEVIINNVQVEDLSGGDSFEATLTVDKDTVFDKICDMSAFGKFTGGDSPLAWYIYNKDLMDKDIDKYTGQGSAMKGVFDVSITGNHVDSFYGSYWWD